MGACLCLCFLGLDNKVIIFYSFWCELHTCSSMTASYRRTDLNFLPPYFHPPHSDHTHLQTQLHTSKISRLHLGRLWRHWVDKNLSTDRRIYQNLGKYFCGSSWYKRRRQHHFRHDDTHTCRFTNLGRDPCCQQIGSMWCQGLRIETETNETDCWLTLGLESHIWGVKCWRLHPVDPRTLKTIYFYIQTERRWCQRVLHATVKNRIKEVHEQNSWPRPLERVLSRSGMILYIIFHHVLNFCPGRLWLHILATRSTNASLSQESSRSLCWVMAWNVAREMILVSTFSLQPEFKEEEERQRGMEVKRVAVDRRPSQLWCVQ